MAKKKPTPRDECADTFEESLDELEKIVAELESGKLGLSDALARYEQGVKHLKGCQQLLERAERQDRALERRRRRRQSDHAAVRRSANELSLEEKAAARGQRRTTVAKSSSGTHLDRDDDIDDPNRLF